jgi:hypothetical protein
VREREIREAFKRAGGVDPAARERSWHVVRAAFRSHPPQRRRPGWVSVFLASAVLAMTGAGVAAASAPDSGVGRWVRGVLGIEERETRPALVRVPGGGKLLAEAGGSVWMVAGDASKRRLGRYSGAAWSPRGLFVIAWRERVLTAVDPRGDVRWSLARPDPVALARWAPGDGFRIAYLSGGWLRIVNGDGTGDRGYERAADVAPAWRPDDDHVLAYGVVGRWTPAAGSHLPAAASLRPHGKAPRVTPVAGGADCASRRMGAGRPAHRRRRPA